MKLKRMSIAVANRMSKPPKKTKSAISSYLLPDCILPLIAKKESRQLSIKKMMAMATVSSITVFSDILRNFNEVSTTKHNPSKLDDALRICGDL